MKTNQPSTTAMKNSRNRKTSLALAGPIAALLAVQSLPAATVNWDGDTSVTWSDPLNWDTAPTNDLLTDIASFNLAAYGGPVFSPDAGTTSINGITIGAANGPMTLTTTNLSIGSGGITIANGAGAFGIVGGVTIGAAQSWANNSSTAMTTAGVLAIDNQLSLTAGTFTLGNFANTGTGGVVLNGATAQAGNAAAFGTGTLTLTSGTLSSDGGTARSFGNALAINGSVTLGDATNNGALAFTGAKTITGSNTITLAGSGGATFSTAAMSLAAGSNTTFSSASGVLTMSGGFNTNGGTATLTLDTAANAVNLSGAFSGTAGTLVLAGTGTNVTVGALTTTANAIQINSTTGGVYTFSGASTFTGGVTLTSGKLNINSVGVAGTSGPLGNSAVANTGNTFTINGGTIDNTSGSAKVVLNVNPITVGGDFAFSTSAGTSTASNLTLPGAITMAANRTVTLNGAGALTLSGLLTNTADSVRTLTVNAGTGAVATSILTIGSYNLTGAGSTAARTNIINGTGRVTLSGVVGNGVSAGSGLTYSGSGTLTLSGANTFTGQLTVAAGTLSIASINNNGANGTLGNSSVSLPVILGSSGGNTGTLQYTAGSGSSDKGFALATGGTGAFDVTTALTLSGPITGSGNLSKVGAGVLTLDPSVLNGNNQGVGVLNQFTGTTTINNGKIKLTSYNVAGAAYTLGAMFGLQKSVYDTTGSTGAIGLDVTPTGTATISAPVLGGLAGSVNLATAITSYTTVTTLYLNPQSGVSASYGGQITNGSGAMTLTKMGPGTQTLTGTSNYTGATTVIAGTLALSGVNGSILNSASYTVRGGTLLLDNSGGTFISRLADATALSLGSLTLSSYNGAGANTETVGTTTFAVGGKVTINNGATGGDQTTLALSTGNVVRSAGAAIDFVGTNGTLGGGANSPNVTTFGYDVSAAAVNGILPWATVGGTQWAENNSNSIRAYSGAFNTNLTTATNSQNAQTTGTLALVGAAVANSLNIVASGAGQSLSLGANNLTLGSAAASPAAILKSGTDAYTISGTGQVRAGSAGAGTELITHVEGGALTISAPLNTAIVGIAKGGSGTLILSGPRATTFSAPIGIGGGTLEFQGSSTSSTGGFTGPGNLTINLNPGQVFTSTGPVNSNFSGSVLVKGGTLNTGAFSSGGLGIAPYAVGVLYSTGGLNNIELNGGILAFNYTVGRYLGTGPDQIQLTGGVSGFSAVTSGGAGGGFNLNGNSSTEIVWGAANEASNAFATGYFNPSTLVLNDNATATAAFTFASPLDLNASTRTISNSSLYFASTLSGVIRTSSGTAGLTKTGIGTLVLSGANTYNGAVAVNAGVLNIQNATALGTTAAGTTVASGAVLQIQGNLTIGAEALTLSGAGIDDAGALRNISGNSTYGGLITLGSATLINSDTANNTLTLSNAGTITGATFGLTVGGAGNTTINSSIGTTTGTLTKYGSGTLTLTGTNTYTGVTRIDAGTLQFGKTASLYNSTLGNWTAANIPVGNGATLAVNVGGTGEFTTGDVTTLLGSLGGANGTSTTGFAAGSAIAFNTTTASGGTFTVADLLANSTGAGGGAIGLTKLGTNTLVLSNDNTYTGPTVISAGTLQLGSGGTTGKLSISSGILNNGTLTINRSDAVAQGSDFSTAPITGTGAFTQAGAGTTTLNAANTFSGTTTVSAGVLNLTNALALQNSALVTTGAGTLTLNGPTTLTLGGLSGTSGNLATIITSGYTGTVTALTLNPTGSVTYGGVIANGAMTLTKTGTGTQILSGANLYTGTTTVNRGTLTIGNGTTGSLNGTTGTDLTFTGTGTFNVAEALSSNQGMGALTLSAGDATITSTGIAAQTSTLTFASLAARPVGATGNFTLATNTTATQNKIKLTSTTNAPLNSGGSNNQGLFFGTTEYARYDTTAGYFRAVTYGTDTNASPIVATAATLGINDATKDVKISGAITAQTTASVNTLNLVANTLTLSSTAQVLSVNGILSNGGTIATTGSTITTAGNIQPAVAGGELVINTAGNLGLTAIIQNNTSASSLTKSGTGQLTLNNSRSTYTGGTVVNAGTVTFAADQGAATDTFFGTGPVTFNPGTTMAMNRTYIGNALTLNNATVTAGNSFTSTLAGTTTLTGISTISITGNLTISGNLTGTGGLIKTGATVVPVNGTNNYTGPTTISGGGLTFLKPASLYNADSLQWTKSNITVTNGGSLTLKIGGTGEFTTTQASTIFGNLVTDVNSNGLQAGAFFGVDAGTSGGSFTISTNLTDSTGVGSGAVGIRFFGNNSMGASTLELTGTNTYSGQTILDRQGLLKVSSINSVYTNAALGTVHSASSSLGAPTTVANGTIQLGTQASFQGAGLIYTGTGETTDRVLSLGGGGGDNYRFDQSGTGALKFTSNMAMTDTRGTKNIVLQGSTAGTGEIAGVIPNALSSTLATTITKSGTGTWTLSAANLFTGLTTVSGGALVLANAEALRGGIGSAGGFGALTFNGGVVGLGAGDFSRPLAAANTVGAATFTGAGGWAAYGADRLVNLGGGSAPITWATASTGFNGQTLILSNTTATHMVTLQNPLDLGNATRTVQVDNGAATIDGALSGLLSGAGGGLNKTGLGTLALSGASANTYTGLTTVGAGTLRLGITNAIASGNAVTVVPTGAAAVLDLAGFDQTIGGAGLTLGGATVSSAASVVNSTGTSTLTLSGGATAVTYSATNNPLGATVSVTTVSLANAAQTFNVGDSTSVTGSGNELTISSAITAAGASSALTKTGLGSLKLDGAQGYDILNANAGTTNVNGVLGTAPGLAVVTVAAGTNTLRFGSVSQTLSSLTIGAGATVTFTSGAATGSFSDGGGKAAGFGSAAPSFGSGSAVVPEPGTIGLLLVGALGVLNRRRRQA